MGTPYEAIKGELISIIKEMSAIPWLFAKDPGRDFTRKRKLSFESMLCLLLGMGGSSLQAELLEHSGYGLDTATSSAFIQQRNKLLPFARNPKKGRLRGLPLVLRMGLEPIRPFGQRILSPLCLPFHHRSKPNNFTTRHPTCQEKRKGKSCGLPFILLLPHSRLNRLPALLWLYGIDKGVVFNLFGVVCAEDTYIPLGHSIRTMPQLILKHRPISTISNPESGIAITELVEAFIVQTSCLKVILHSITNTFIL